MWKSNKRFHFWRIARRENSERDSLNACDSNPSSLNRRAKLSYGKTDRKSYFERFFESRPAWILAGVIMLGYLIGIVGDRVTVCHFSSQPAGCAGATSLLSQDNALILRAGTYWQFFTSIFVTSSLLDAGFNALAVLILDRFVESSFNHTRFFAIFFFSALLGNLFSLANPPLYSSAGTSGGIFGLFAATFSFTWAAERKIDKSTLLFFLALFFTSSFVFPNVDYYAHLGGSISGFIAGPLLYELLKGKVSQFESVSSSSVFGRVCTGTLIALISVGSIAQFLLFVSS